MKTRRTAVVLALLTFFSGAVFAGGRPTDQDLATRISDRTPVILDGVALAPGEFERPDGPITWVVTKEDAEDGTIHAFTSREDAREFMREVMDREFGRDRDKGLKLVTANSCSPWNNEYSYFNKDVGCGGSAHLYLYPGNEYAHLDFDGWNNRISCVKAACVNAWTTLYACRFFDMTADEDCQTPEALFVFPGVIISDLNTTSPNFNNRTSSIRFCIYYPTCN